MDIMNVLHGTQKKKKKEKSKINKTKEVSKRVSGGEHTCDS